VITSPSSLGTLGGSAPAAAPPLPRNDTARRPWSTLVTSRPYSPANERTAAMSSSLARWRPQALPRQRPPFGRGSTGFLIDPVELARRPQVHGDLDRLIAIHLPDRRMLGSAGRSLPGISARSDSAESSSLIAPRRSVSECQSYAG
jgi:hypothetical protein